MLHLRDPHIVLKKIQFFWDVAPMALYVVSNILKALCSFKIYVTIPLDTA